MIVDTKLQKEDIFEIIPIFSPSTNCALIDFENFVNSIKEKIKSLLFENNIYDFKKIKTKDEIKNIFVKMNPSLPLIYHSDIEEKNFPFTISFSVFSILEEKINISKFIFDMLNRLLFYRKPIDINAHRSIKFKFKNFNQTKYLFSEFFINIANEKEKSLLKRNIKSFIDEMKLIIMSASYAKDIVSSSMDKNKEDFGNNNSYIFQISEETRLNEIKENLGFLINKNPNIFDSDIMDYLHLNSLIFKGNFTSIRNPKHISRLIAFSYFFKKSINQIKSQIQTSKRIVKIKLFKTNLSTQKKDVLGILIVLDLLHENEYFEKSYILKSISQIINDFRYVTDSYIVDRRDFKTLTFYLEIEKENLSYFSLKEISDLNKKLNLAFSLGFKEMMNPLFQPGNEEEILRNIIILTKQLNYVKDIPQVIISFDKQTSKEISFIVILLRVLKKNTPSLKELFSSSKTLLKFSLDETKIVGLLKKKYPKEANIFRLFLNKFDFLRKDISLDLRKARQTIFKELTNILGKFRDFNGGLLAKQLDAMQSLKNLMAPSKKSSDFLLEEFFYSINPAIQQSIIDPKILKNLYMMILKMLKKDFKNNNFLIETKNEKNHFYIIVKTFFSKIKEDIILAVKKLKFKSFEILYSSLDKNDQKALGLILISKDLNKKDLLYQTIMSELEKNFKI